MIKNRTKHTVGLCVLGMTATFLLNGCGGSSFQKGTFGTYQNAVPAVYGLEGTGANGNLTGNLGGPFFFETSGLGSADGNTAYLTTASDFAIAKNPNNATLLGGVDPNATGKVPLGFSGTIGTPGPKGPAGTLGTAGEYIDANSGGAAAHNAVLPGTSVVFRAAISNGVSQSTRSTIPITYNGVSLSSTDPQWTLGTLPMTFNYSNVGPLANATYVTGTPVQSGNGTPTPFTLPFTTTGVHTAVVTVTDDAGQQTATTFAIPVVAPVNVAVLLQNIIPDNADGTAGTGSLVIAPGDTVTIDGGPGIGVYPATGYNAATGQPSAPTIADGQGSVILFTTPGTHKVTDATTDAKGNTTTVTQTLTIAASAAGTTIIQ
jgi:hypothetical protein